MYLFDTDTLSYLLRREPPPTLIARIALVPPEQQFTSTITVGELYYGAHRAQDRTATLLQRIESRLLPNLIVLPFDVRASRYYGAVRADLERLDTPIGDADLRIAAIALAYDLIVVTGNRRRFERVSRLNVENWLS